MELNDLLLNILEQHGLEAMLTVIHDEIDRSYDDGHAAGELSGWCDCYEAYRWED